MIGTPNIGKRAGQLSKARISGTCFEGLRVETSDGKPANFAIVDASGSVLEFGPHVANEAMDVVLAIYRNFLIGEGHIRTYSDSSSGLSSNPAKKVA